ncbi:hypothetical protein AAC389_06970 [Rhodococcus qingshengii]|uniref:hypothetical protein n=1 Tax=Rhodococcus qingshengii TaxID=334542 RepID=UPI00311CD17E
MSDTTSKGGGQIATPLTEGDELGIDIFTSGEWLVEEGIEAIIKLCTQPIISSYPKRKARVESAVRKVFEVYGIQERIDENRLAAKEETSIQSLRRLKARWRELAALKTKQEVAN